MQSKAKIVLVLLLFWVFAFVGYYAVRNSMDEDTAVAADIEEERNEKTNPVLKDMDTKPKHDVKMQKLKELSFEEFQVEMKDWQSWLRSNDEKKRAEVRNTILQSVGVIIGQILVANIVEALVFNVAMKAWKRAAKSAGAAVGKTAGRIVMQSGTRLAVSFARVGVTAAAGAAARFAAKAALLGASGPVGWILLAMELLFLGVYFLVEFLYKRGDKRDQWIRPQDFEEMEGKAKMDKIKEYEEKGGAYPKDSILSPMTNELRLTWLTFHCAPGYRKELNGDSYFVAIVRNYKKYR